MSIENPHRGIIVLANSKPWCSAIERSFPKKQLSWVLDFDGLEIECRTNRFCAAIVEIPTKKLGERVVRAADLANNAFDLKLFALGDGQMPDWQNLLRWAGFSSWIWSHLQVSNLVKQISLHQQNTPFGFHSLESSIESQLPWANASDDQIA